MELTSQHTFESASNAILNYLHETLGFGLWMVTRVEGNDWIVLSVQTDKYDVSQGTVFKWTDSFCSRMVKGYGPRIAPDSSLVPSYAEAPIGQQVPIRAYIGTPLMQRDGSLFGTLCAIDPDPQPAEILQYQDMIELLASLLSTILANELMINSEQRRIEKLEIEAHTDGMTGLFNRRAWDLLLIKEEERARRYGSPVAAVVIDLDQLKVVNDSLGHDAGDQLISRAARVMQASIRSCDILARLGGDEFGIIFVKCDSKEAKALAVRLRNNLAAEGINASQGMAIRSPKRSLQAAWSHADHLMFEEKRQKRQA